MVGLELFYIVLNEIYCAGVKLGPLKDNQYSDTRSYYGSSLSKNK